MGRSEGRCLPRTAPAHYGLRADEIASRYGASGGKWAGALRLFTGAASVFLNIGHSAELKDWTGVAQHLIAPGILVLMAETEPAYRRNLAARLTAAEVEEADRVQAARDEAAREEERVRELERAEDDRLRAIRAEEDEHQADRERQEEERQRRMRREDEEHQAAMWERQESLRGSRSLEEKRLELEARRLDAAAGPAPVHTYRPHGRPRWPRWSPAAQHLHGAPTAATRSTRSRSVRTPWRPSQPRRPPRPG